MPKGYVVTTYREIRDAAKIDSYAQLAGPAFKALGGRFLVASTPVKTYQSGLPLRTIVCEFENTAKAQEAVESRAFQDALAVLGGAAVLDVRILPGME